MIQDLINAKISKHQDVKKKKTANEIKRQTAFYIK